MQLIEKQFYTDTEKERERCTKIMDMLKTDGWLIVRKWLDEEIERLNRSIYNCAIEDVERHRSEARGLQRVLDYTLDVDKELKYYSEHYGDSVSKSDTEQ